MSLRLTGPAEYREDIRKSRFIALAAPVDTPEQAKDFIATHSDPSASHNCWAWKIGQQYRFSDDGEPGGTAGRPILAAIEGQDCDQVVVLVIRFYGGIQLGTGGLARAYGGSANRCLQEAAKQVLIPREALRCHLPFDCQAALYARQQEWDIAIEGEDYDAAGVWLSLSLPAGGREALIRQLSDLSRGRLQLAAD